MIRFALGACSAFLLAAPASAQTSAQSAARLQPAFGNTVLSTYPDGRTARLWLQPEGSYRGQGRRGGFSSGRWTVKGQQICFKQSRPLAAPFSHCTPLPKAGAGASWTGKAVTGEPIRLSIVPGTKPAPVTR